VAQLAGGAVGLTHHSKNFLSSVQHFASKLVTQAKEKSPSLL